MGNCLLSLFARKGSLRMLRFLRYIIESIAAFVAVTVVLALLVAWRLSVSPVSSDFLTPYIEAGIENILPDSQVHLGASLLTWNQKERAVSVHAENIHIENALGIPIGDIPSFDAKVSLIGILFGQFMPKDLTIDHPQIKLVHNKDGAFTFGGRAVSSAPSSVPRSSETMGNVIRRVSARLSHAALMHKLSVKSAVFDIHDDVTQQDWSVSIPEISITRNTLPALAQTLEWGALDGRMTVEVTQKDALASLNVHYIYDPAKELHTLSTVFNELTPAYLAGGHPETLGLDTAAIIDLPLTGEVKATFDKTFSIEAIDAQIHGGEGQLKYADFWDKPCPVKSLDLNASYDRKNHKLDIGDTAIDFDGPVLALKISGTPPSDPDKDMDFTANVTIDNMPMNRYGELWPKALLPNPRYWLEANLRDGTYQHADLSVRGAVNLNDLSKVSVTDGGGKMIATNGTVTYLEGLPPVQNVNATATFDLKKMDVQITSGGIGNIRLSPFAMQVTGLASEDQDIDVPLKVSGPVPEVLRLLDRPPLGYAKALGVSPDDVSGTIEGSVHFHFPLLRTLQMKDVDIHASANAANIASTKLVPSIAIDQGNLAMNLDMSGFSFNGTAALDKVPFQITWQENFAREQGKPLSHATVVGSIKDDQWANFGLKVFDGTKGPMNLTLDIVKPDKNKSIFSGSLDMTPAALTFGLLNWKKAANVPAILKFTATQTGDKPVNVSSLSLHGAQITAVGDAVMSSDMSHILALNLAPLAIGRTNTTLHFLQSFGDAGAVTFDAKGVALDITGFRNDKTETADLRPKTFSIQVDKLYTSESGAIDHAQGTAARDRDGWSAINLQGMADGDTPLSIALAPQADGHSTFAINSDDFGKMMKGLGFTDTIKGGKLTVSGASTTDSPRLIVGKAKISEFTVEKLPALALLLNATSPFGFTGILTDSADFSHLEGEFHWQGDDLTVTRAHAAGSAIGINIEGKVNLNSGAANLDGTLVPFSVMNNILNYIPVIGDILTGGHDQGVLAVSYTIKGNLGAPDISVNPVSLLTPGFIRNLFFRGDASDDPEPEGK